MALSGRPAGHLVESQEAATVMRLPAQAVRQRGQDLVPPGAQEVVLGVRPREPGI
jgi:hypothetical protein